MFTSHNLDLPYLTSLGNDELHYHPALYIILFRRFRIVYMGLHILRKSSISIREPGSLMSHVKNSVIRYRLLVTSSAYFYPHFPQTLFFLLNTTCNRQRFVVDRLFYRLYLNISFNRNFHRLNLIYKIFLSYLSSYINITNCRSCHLDFLQRLSFYFSGGISFAAAPSQKHRGRDASKGNRLSRQLPGCKLAFKIAHFRLALGTRPRTLTLIAALRGYKFDVVCIGYLLPYFLQYPACRFPVCHFVVIFMV